MVGRKVALKIDDETVAGIRTKGVSINRNPIDITSDDDDGWRKLLEEPGEKQVDLTVSGVTKDDVLKKASLTGETLHDLELAYPDGSKIEGDFFLASFSETGEYNDAVTFDASLQSSGVVEYTPASS